jgi:hypothetical protein
MDGTGGPSPRLPVSKVRLRIKPADAPAAYAFTASQHQFLQTYAETLDVNRACEVSGLKPHQVRKNPYIQAELDRLRECALYKHRATATVGNHHRLMAKFEQTMDKTGDARVKQGYAGVLARMSTDAMKAAGEMAGDDGAATVMGFQLVINIGGQETQTAANIPIEALPDASG